MGRPKTGVWLYIESFLTDPDECALSAATILGVIGLTLARGGTATGRGKPQP
jgi:hypothetical protein